MADVLRFGVRKTCLSAPWLNGLGSFWGKSVVWGWRKLQPPLCFALNSLKLMFHFSLQWKCPRVANGKVNGASVSNA